ncbi:hypothetical protein [Azospirillum halopraeferens]|uniref:hypothetical protein n=1 Tax=Azospirillum halopraeferens TaxID=34010 RepID=UPI0003F91CBE|nr:hypothetical protein [Azospirillum halopraeferens]
MSDSYIDTKVREALTAARGSHAVAQKILIAWAADDHRLLLGLAQPFMKAIAGAAVDRAVRRGGAPRPPQGPGRSQTGGRSTAPALSREALERVLSRMGDDSAPAAPAAAAAARPSAAAILGKGAPAAPSGGASHEKSMMAIAKAFAVKKMG